MVLVSFVGCAASEVAVEPPAQAARATPCPDWVHRAHDGVSWEPNGDADGIQTFVGTVPDSDFLAFKGAGPIDAPISKIASVLIDTHRHGEWVPHFGGMRVVRVLSETEKVIYRHVTTPFVIADRDFVVKAGIRKDEASGHLLIEFSSTDDPAAPVNDGKVRGVLHSSGYRMWPIDGGARTMMIFTIHVDPKGSVPAWIVNLFQTGYARTNLQNIERQASKADVEQQPKVKAAFLDFEPCRSARAGS